MRRVLALLLLAPIGSPLITPLLLAYSRSDLPRMVNKLDLAENTSYRQAGFEGTRPTLRDDFSRM
jgi:hypothetical protein